MSVVLIALLGCQAEPDALAPAGAPVDVQVGALPPQAPDVSPDTDGDGLSDRQEAELGTDPARPDTDGDGLSDFDEVHVHATDPLAPDTDGDWVDDGLEVERGTDPHSAEPPALVVEGLEANRVATVTLTAGPPEGEVQLMYGLEASLLCPPDHNGVCWVMEDPTPWDAGHTDALGEVTLTVVVPAVPDATPFLVQASVIAPDGTYVASAPVEALVPHPARACGEAPELDPDLDPASLGDGAVVLACDPGATTCADAASVDAAALLALPSPWTATATCLETSIADACCYTLTLDDPTR